MKTQLLVAVAGIAMTALISVLPSRADPGTQREEFAWGKEKRGIKIGVRVEKVKGRHPDLIAFTTAMKNCGEQPVKIAAGDTWHGPLRPEYVIGDEKGN